MIAKTLNPELFDDMIRHFLKAFLPLTGAILFLLFTSCRNDKKSYLEHGDLQSDTLNSLFEELALSYESSDRTAWQKPGAVLELMGDLTDKTVADIGAGTGYFTIRLAQQAKKVIAVDIDTMALNYIDSTKLLLEPHLADKIETRLAKPDNPMLSPNEVDLVLMVNTYPFIPDRIDYFRTLKERIKPGGQVLIVDFKKKRIPIGPPASQKVALNELEGEMEEAGFELITSDDRMLDFQYVVLIQKKAQ